MTIRELIEELEYIAKKYGDEVDVVIPRMGCDGFYDGYEDPEPYYPIGSGTFVL